MKDSNLLGTFSTVLLPDHMKRKRFKALLMTYDRLLDKPELISVAFGATEIEATASAISEHGSLEPTHLMVVEIDLLPRATEPTYSKLVRKDLWQGGEWVSADAKEKGNESH